MPSTQLDSIRTGTDARGRAVPMSRHDALIRGQAIARGLDSLDDMGDADEQRESFEQLVQGLEEDRISDRKRFR